jgi:RNA polymerase sigma-70 factor (ECF subfamily)
MALQAAVPSVPDLVRHAQHGNAESLARLAATFRPELVRYSRRFTPTWHDAEDVAQSVLLKMVTHLGTFRQGANLKTWLFTIAYNEAISVFRRTSRLISQHELEDGSGNWFEMLPAAEDDLLQQLCKEEWWDELRQLVRALPPALREIVHCRFVEGLNTRESAQRLGISVAAAKSRSMRAVARLRTAIQQRQIETVLCAASAS